MKPNYYFDNAATTWPKPESVYQYMDSFFRSSGVNPGRGGHAMSADAGAMTYQARQMLAQFFGFFGDANRVVFTLNATDSLNTAISGLLDAGDHIVTTRLEHNAVLRISNYIERDSRIEVTRVPGNTDGYVNPQDIENSIKSNTRMIIFNHASNVLGTVQPLEQVAQIAKTHNLLLVVDTAQSAGIRPIKMDEYGIDVLTFTGHKGLFGPMGVGGLIVAENISVRPARYGGTGVNSIAPFQPEQYPQVLEAGTAPLPGIAGLHAAQLWFRELGRNQQRENNMPASDSHAQLCEYAIQHIHRTEQNHVEQIENQLKQFQKVKLVGKPRRHERVAVVNFIVEGMSAEQVGDRLDADHHVCVRAGLHCAPLVHIDAGTAEIGGSVRVSPGYFTDDEDMAALLNGLQDILS